ncbi:MAG: hypothetical protein JNG88_15100 [Phycisphaerales bacterium]|nr:hypothetical protein [Phycisphaerales bacterium]
MRIAAQACLLILMLAATGGCASKQAATRIDPAPFELPQMKFVEPTLPAIVEVQGRQSAAPVGLLTPSFEPEPLTLEEEAAMAPRVKQFDFLALYKPERGVKHGVSPQTGGATFGSYGSGAKFGLGPATSAAFAANVYAGPPAAVSPYPVTTAKPSPWSTPELFVGQPMGNYVGYGPPSRIASHRTRMRP